MLQEETDELGWQFFGFHNLRRTWATQLLSADVDAMVVCDWGGWNDLDTFLDHYRGRTRPRRSGGNGKSRLAVSKQTQTFKL